MRSEENERSENAGVLAHNIHESEAMPNEGIALMCRRVDRSGTEERHETVKYKMSRSWGEAPHCSRGERGASSLQRTRSCVSVLSSRSSNRSGVIAFFTPFVVIGYRDTAGHRRLTTGQPSFGADKMKCRNNGSADGSDDLQTKGRDCASPKHTQSGPSQTRNTNGDNGGSAMEGNMQK